MATLAVASVEFKYCAQTPQSNKSIHFRTPNSNLGQNTKENASTPARKNLFNALKSLSARGKSRIESDEFVQKSPSRRKSAWDLFGRRIRNESNSDHQETHIKPVLKVTDPAPNGGSEDTYELSGASHRIISRRKSLSDVFHTLSQKVSVKTLSRKSLMKNKPTTLHNGRHGEFSTTLEDPFGAMDRMGQEGIPKEPLPDEGIFADDYIETCHSKIVTGHADRVDYAANAINSINSCNGDSDSGNQAQNHAEDLVNRSFPKEQTPSKLSLHLPSLMDLEDGRALVDEFQAAQTHRFPSIKIDSDVSGRWSGSQAETLPEAENNFIGDDELRSSTPDDYLQALIEAHCPPVVIPAPFSGNQEELSAYPFPHEHQPTHIDFPKDDCTVPRLIESYSKKIRIPTSSGVFFCPNGSSFESSNHRDQRPTATVCDVYSDSEDEEVTNNKYTSDDHVDRSIRLTLAKMSKNYHAYDSDDFPFEENQKEVWNTIVVGDQILHKIAPKKTKKISSLEDDFVRHPSHNKILEDTIDLRSPAENGELTGYSLRPGFSSTAQNQGIPRILKFNDMNAAQSSMQPEGEQLQGEALWLSGRDYANPSDLRASKYPITTLDPGIEREPDAKIFPFSDFEGTKSEDIGRYGVRMLTGVAAKDSSNDQTLSGGTDLWKQLFLGSDLRNSYDEETAFLVPDAFPIKRQGSILATEAVTTDQDDPVYLSDDILSFDMALDCDVARSFLGSQFSGSYCPSVSADYSLHIYKEIMGEENDRNTLIEPIRTIDTAVSRTWFDLAKRYKATHPDSNGPNDDCATNLFETGEPLTGIIWDDLAEAHISLPSQTKGSDEDLPSRSTEKKEPVARSSWFDFTKRLRDKKNDVWIRSTEVPEALESSQETITEHQDDNLLQSLLPRVERSASNIGVFRYQLGRRPSDMALVEHIENVEDKHTSKAADALFILKREHSTCTAKSSKQTDHGLERNSRQASGISLAYFLEQGKTPTSIYQQLDSKIQSPDITPQHIRQLVDDQTGKSLASSPGLYLDVYGRPRGLDVGLAWGTSSMYPEVYGRPRSSNTAPESTDSEFYARTRTSQAKAGTISGQIYPEAYGRPRKSYVEAETTLPSMYQHVYGRARQGENMVSQKLANGLVLRANSRALFAPGFQLTNLVGQMKEVTEAGIKAPKNMPIVDDQQSSELTLEKRLGIQADMFEELGTSSKDESPQLERKSVRGLVNIFQAHGLIPSSESPFKTSPNPFSYRKVSLLPIKTQAPSLACTLDGNFPLVPRSGNGLPHVPPPAPKWETLPFSLRLGLEVGMRSEASLADTVITDSSFGEVLERSNPTTAVLSEDVSEEQEMSESELYT